MEENREYQIVDEVYRNQRQKNCSKKDAGKIQPVRGRFIGGDACPAAQTSSVQVAEALLTENSIKHHPEGAPKGRQRGNAHGKLVVWNAKQMDAFELVLASFGAQENIAMDPIGMRLSIPTDACNGIRSCLCAVLSVGMKILRVRSSKS